MSENPTLWDEISIPDLPRQGRGLKSIIVDRLLPWGEGAPQPA